MSAPPVLKGGSMQIRVAANGFIVTYDGKEYVFLTASAMNTWIASTSIAG